MRGLIRNLLISDAELTAVIPEGRWFGSGSIGNDPVARDNFSDTPPRPFAEIRFSMDSPGMAHITRRRLEVWVHDEYGDYSRIDRVIKRVKEVLESSQQVAFSDPETHEDSELMLAEWVSDSTDLYDGGYRTNCRSTGFDLIGKG